MRRCARPGGSDCFRTMTRTVRGAENLARLDAERVEQIGELAVEVGAEPGDGRISEAGRPRTAATRPGEKRATAEIT